MLEEPRLLDLELWSNVELLRAEDELGLRVELWLLDDGCCASNALLEIERIPPQIKLLI